MCEVYAFSPNTNIRKNLVWGALYSGSLLFWITLDICNYWHDDEFLNAWISKGWRTPHHRERALFFHNELHDTPWIAIEARALSLNLTVGMCLVGTGQSLPPPFMMHNLVSTRIIIKPSLLQIKGREVLGASLSHIQGRGRIKSSLGEEAHLGTFILQTFLLEKV